MSESLRDQLAANFDNILTTPSDDATPVETLAPEVTATEEATPKDVSRETQTAEERARDEQGRFVAAEKKAAAEKTAPAEPKAPIETTPQQVAPPVVETPAPIARPSTWKKEHWGDFDALAKANPKMAEYIMERESQYAKGVSTYKQEWDRAKPLLEAIAPFEQELRQYNIVPHEHVARLMGAHKQLALGTPEQKLQMFARLAQDYQVPLQQLFQQGQDGQMHMVQPPPPTIDPAQIQTLIQQQVSQSLQQSKIEQEIAGFSAQKDKYPHFNEVRDTMAGLLQSGIADGLESAYQAALRLPQYSHLYEAQQQQQRQAEAARVAEEKRRVAEIARKKAVSPRSVTPTGNTDAGTGNKGLRAVYEEAFNTHAGGRV